MKSNKFDAKLFYPLIDNFDKEFFSRLMKGVGEKYHFKGTLDEKKYFLKSILCLQMLKDYRAPLIPIFQNLEKVTDLYKINLQIQALNFKLDYSWAIWTRDKKIGSLAENLQETDFELNGTDDEFDEFVLRYLVSIWLIDWEGPLYLILKTFRKKEFVLKDKIELLKLWDFTNIFFHYY